MYVCMYVCMLYIHIYIYMYTCMYVCPSVRPSVLTSSGLRSEGTMKIASCSALRALSFSVQSLWEGILSHQEEKKIHNEKKIREDQERKVKEDQERKAKVHSSNQASSCSTQLVPFFLCLFVWLSCCAMVKARFTFSCFEIPWNYLKLVEVSVLVTKQIKKDQLVGKWAAGNARCCSSNRSCHFNCSF